MARARTRVPVYRRRLQQELGQTYDWSEYEDGEAERPRQPAAIHAPLTPPELWEFVRETWGVELSRTVHPECAEKGHAAPFDAFASAFFVRPVVGGVFVEGQAPGSETIAGWEGSRGFAGKTYMLALLTLSEMVALAAHDVLLAATKYQGTIAHDYTRDAWAASGAPAHLLLSDPTTYETRLANGGHARVIAGATTSVRGGHEQRLRMDEIDEMRVGPMDGHERRVPVFDAAMGRTMRAARRPDVLPGTVFSSTHQYVAGAMTELKRRAAERGWPIRRWCYRENLERTLTRRTPWGGGYLPIGTPVGWLDPVDVAAKRREVAVYAWENEYELGEPNPEGRAIDEEAVRRVFTPRLGEYSGKLGEYIEIEPPERTGHYAHGADWGRKLHNTVVITLRVDVTPWRLVAYVKDRGGGWPRLARLLTDRIERYGGMAAHDASGVGDAVRSHLGAGVVDVIFAGRQRDKLIDDGVLLIEEEPAGLEAPLIYSLREALLTASVDDLYGTGTSGHVPDDFAALALARHAARFVGPQLLPSATRETPGGDRRARTPAGQVASRREW